MHGARHRGKGKINWERIGRRLPLAVLRNCPWAEEIYELPVHGRHIGPGEAMEEIRFREDAGVFCREGRADEAAACFRFGDISEERIPDLSVNRNHLKAPRRLFL